MSEPPRKCQFKPLTHRQRSFWLMASFLLGGLIALCFMIWYALGERLGTTPFLRVFDIEGLTARENMLLLFVWAFLGFGFIMMTLFGIYRGLRKKVCLDIDEMIEEPIWSELKTRSRT